MVSAHLCPQIASTFGTHVDEDTTVAGVAAERLHKGITHSEV